MPEPPSQGADAASNLAEARARSKAIANAFVVKRRFPPLGVSTTVVVCAVAIVVIRDLLDVPALDAAARNIATLILTFIAAMTLLVWYSWRSAYSRAARLAPVFVLAVLAIAAVATLRVDQVNGALVPTLRFRWTPKPDQQLPVSPATTKGQTVEISATTTHDYPQFLGPQRNATLTGIPLERDWKAHPPERVWSRPIGAGWSAFAVVGNHAVTLEQRGTEELVTCYAVDSGEVQWAEGIQARHESTLGGVGPRSTPTIYQGKVYALGGTGVLRCLDGATGHVIWQHDLLREFGVASAAADQAGVSWGRAASPLIVDDLVVVPVGGPAGGPYVSLIAYRLDSGEEIWRGGERQVGYSSPSLVTLGGQRQIVIVNEDNITGHNPETGKVLWTQPWYGGSASSANTTQTVSVDDTRLFTSKGYGGGAMLFEVTEQSGRWQTREIWHNPRVLQTKFANVVMRDGYVYGLSDGILECIDLEQGKRQWKRGRYGHGQLLLVDDLILVLGELGELVLVEANPRQHVELGQIQALEGKTWNTMALVGPLLLIRNAEQAACYRLATTKESRTDEEK